MICLEHHAIKIKTHVITGSKHIQNTGVSYYIPKQVEINED